MELATSAAFIRGKQQAARTAEFIVAAERAAREEASLIRIAVEQAKLIVKDQKVRETELLIEKMQNMSKICIRLTKQTRNGG